MSVNTTELSGPAAEKSAKEIPRSHFRYDAFRQTTLRLATSLSSSPMALLGCVIFLILALAALTAPWLVPYDTLNPAASNLMDASLPPAWHSGGEAQFKLGTDSLGRDLLSTIIFGLRSSVLISILSVLFAGLLGTGVGLVSGYFGGVVDALLMRIVDIQLAFPAILTALLINGVLRIVYKGSNIDSIAPYLLVFAIGISGWMQFARAVRASTLVEKNRDYVAAALVIGRSSWSIMLSHILPNVMGPVLVLGTMFFGVAIVTEATLSFLGIGLPLTQPSLGTLIRTGADYLFSGEWWVVIFPGITLALLVLSVNVIGDWIRDFLNPKLR